jgi:hypothetical protein
LVCQTVGGQFFLFCQNYMDVKLVCQTVGVALSLSFLVHHSIRMNRKFAHYFEFLISISHLWVSLVAIMTMMILNVCKDFSSKKYFWRPLKLWGIGFCACDIDFPFWHISSFLSWLGMDVFICFFMPNMKSFFLHINMSFMLMLQVHGHGTGKLSKANCFF